MEGEPDPTAQQTTKKQKITENNLRWPGPREEVHGEGVNVAFQPTLAPFLGSSAASAVTRVIATRISDMKLFSATTAALCLASTADAFVVAPPLSRVGGVGSTRQSATMVAPLPAASAGAGVASVLQSVVPLIAASGVAEPGSVDAPAWVLPLGAFAVILTAGVIPLVLKVSLWRKHQT